MPCTIVHGHVQSGNAKTVESEDADQQSGKGKQFDEY